MDVVKIDAIHIIIGCCGYQLDVLHRLFLKIDAIEQYILEGWNNCGYKRVVHRCQSIRANDILPMYLGG
jgi:hypothetical protein